MEYQKIIVDDPRPLVRRITLNRPEKRNPLSNEVRSELFHALETADQDESVRVMLIRGAGPCCAAIARQLKTPVFTARRVCRIAQYRAAAKRRKIREIKSMASACYSH